MGDLLDNIRNAYLAGAIIGIILILIGLLSLIQYANSSNFKDIYFGAGFIVFGSMFLWKGALAFIPIKQQSLTSSNANTCPYCGVLTEENATYCEKCKRKLDVASS